MVFGGSPFRLTGSFSAVSLEAWTASDSVSTSDSDGIAVLFPILAESGLPLLLLRFLYDSTRS